MANYLYGDGHVSAVPAEKFANGVPKELNRKISLAQ